jgi:hypothetical protein
MIPIGTAEYSPANPTSGAVNEPRINGNTPNNAEALPAIWPCVSIANEKDVVDIIAIDATKKKIGIANINSGAFNRMATSNKAADELARIKPNFKKVFSEMISEKRPTVWVPMIKAIPLTPNNKLNP